MSLFAKLPVRVLFDPDLSETARLLYAALSWWKFDGDQQPTQQQMAEELGVSYHKVRRAMAELGDAGLVTQARRGRGKSRGGWSNRFDLPDFDCAPVRRPKTWDRAPVRSPEDSAPVRNPTAFTTLQRERKAEHPVRAGQSADGDEKRERRQSIRARLQTDKKLFEPFLPRYLSPEEIGELWEMVAEGEVSESTDLPIKEFTLIQEAQP